MRVALLSALAVVFLALVANRDSGAVLNPHLQPETCGSCHTKVPTEDEGRAGDYFLIKDTIDDTCHVCHEKMCCKP